MQLRSSLSYVGLTTALVLALGCSSGHPGSKPGGAGTNGGAGTQAGGGTTGAGGTTGPGAAGAVGAAGDSASGAAGASSSTTGGAGTGAAGSITDAGAVTDAVVDSSAGSDGASLANWVLTWSDEFNGTVGTKPDSKYWGYDLGGGGWGVAQLQTYTNTAANASMDGQGNLAITAVKDAQGNFTSARLKTQGKFEQAYGRFEMRAKITTGNGMWPAFWMLGNNFGPTPWPDCGEVDIMEVRGTQPYTNLGSLHGPGYSGMHPLTGHFSEPDGGASLSDDFHTYRVEWEVGVIRFYVDENLYETRTPADIPGRTWVYDHPFFIILNVAVGGNWPGSPDGSTVFPQTMLVDYVRVYTKR